MRFLNARHLVNKLLNIFVVNFNTEKYTDTYARKQIRDTIAAIYNNVITIISTKYTKSKEIFEIQ